MDNELEIANDVFHTLRGTPKVWCTLTPTWNTKESRWNWTGTEEDFNQTVEELQLRNLYHRDPDFLKTIPKFDLEVHRKWRLDQIFNHEDLEVSMLVWEGAAFHKERLNLINPIHRFIYFSQH